MSEVSSKAPGKAPGGIRLNKAIADSGYCARRKADELIASGAVQVNGETVQTLGTRVNPETDRVTIHGKSLPSPEKRYVLLHKPEGYVTSRKVSKSQKSIYELLPEGLQDVDSAGRLDQDSSGLLILSSDGDFIHRITHPRFHLPKTYEVRLKKPLSTEAIVRLKAGLLLQPENKLACMEQVKPVADQPKTYRMTLITGYNRQIRRSVESLGNAVLTLKRISFGKLRLGNLPVGAFRSLTDAEVETLLQSAPSVALRQGPKQGQKRAQNKNGQVKHQRQQHRQKKTDR